MKALVDKTQVWPSFPAIESAMFYDQCYSLDLARRTYGGSMLKKPFMLLFCLLISAPLCAADSFVSLMYHRFGEDEFPSTSIRIEQFKAHLEYLQEADYQPISIHQAHAFLNDGVELPEKAVLITIDDAYLSTYTHAHPLFAEYGFPYTVFVATDAVDEATPGYMTWAQMREMETEGATFANHGATHNSLLFVREGESKQDWLKRIRADINKGMQRLREELTPFEKAFAYPYGEYDQETARLVSDLNYIGYGQQSGATGNLSDQRALPRFPMNEAYGEIADFRTKVKSLPLPVISISPWDPYTQETMPSLEIELGRTDDRISELACYVSGQGQVEVEWLAAGEKFRVAPIAELNRGRQRVNCTAPTNSGRYRWFSHPWIIGRAEPGK